MRTSLEFFTICARNYLSQAALLAESIREHHPESGLTIWLLDPGDLPEAVSHLVCRDVSESMDEVEQVELLLRYSILEYSTAVKPACFQTHFKEGAKRVVYLDPDIILFESLRDVERLLDEGHQGVVVPHMNAPFPSDGRFPGDLDILKAGVFNLGFLALGEHPKTPPFLQWWWGWLKTHCYSDHSRGVFTDQKWINFVPTLWPDFGILHHSGYDVAYWNLHERPLSREAGRWMAGSYPLVFFHYSGFTPVDPTSLSKHQNRFTVTPDTPLAEMLQLVAAKLNGFKFSECSHNSTRRAGAPR